MILVLLNQAMALGHDYRALTLDDCLALAREQNPVLTASREKVQELVVAKANSQSLQLLKKKRDRLNGIKVDLTAAWKDQENARQGVATTRQTVTTNEEAYASAAPVTATARPSVWTYFRPGGPDRSIQPDPIRQWLASFISPQAGKRFLNENFLGWSHPEGGRFPEDDVPDAFRGVRCGGIETL
jgi:hypothetical protein